MDVQHRYLPVDPRKHLMRSLNQPGNLIRRFTVVAQQHKETGGAGEFTLAP